MASCYRSAQTFSSAFVVRMATRSDSLTAMAPTQSKHGTRAFDLNMEKVLEHWPVAFALREFIANALDEQAMTGTAEPRITSVRDGTWTIRDFGRGLRYEHLTQNENQEKLRHPDVIGQFGIGLKDALAVCDRKKVKLTLRSRHGDITTAVLPKAGFPDVLTLHGVVATPSGPDAAGTEVLLDGVPDGEMERARSFFLRYNEDDRLLESTKYGDVLAKIDTPAPGRIYVKGLLVAEEPNFLFSYNISRLNASLRRALNRERTNVGRGAYSDRVKDILKECHSKEVAEPLTADLGHFTSGRMHDELAWKDVCVHACRVLQGQEKVVFVTPWQLQLASVSYAVGDGYRPVVVPEDIAVALGGLTDLNGKSMVDLGRFEEEFNESFEFQFVRPEDLTPKERDVYALLGPVAVLAELDLGRLGVRDVLISETMRLSSAGAEFLAVWEPAEARVVVRRDQLQSARSFCGSLLHELEHAASNCSDGTLEFEDALTRRLGTVASGALRSGASHVTGRREG